MPTITTNEYLDTYTGTRVASEAWLINGGKLTIRTDARWHASAPAGMTGILGTLQIHASLGGSVLIDATNVRWMAFDLGTGVVPAIGTTVSQGGVSGYFLGVWDSTLQNAPVVVGAAMPTTGFVKFREVTGGSFSVGALTGISANASSPDVLGWIEVVFDTTASLSGNSGDITTRGGWFDLGLTNGSRGQTIQVPTNGGGATTNVYGIQIETAPGSGIYEWWPATTASTGWTTANLGTDQRAKYVESAGNGVVRIGANSSAAAIGYLPQSGCKMRMPNIIGRSATSAAKTTNISPPTANSGSGRPNFASGPFKLDLKFLACDWWLRLQNCQNLSLTDSVVEGYANTIQNNQTRAIIDNCLFSIYNVTSSGRNFKLSDGVAGVTLTNSKMVYYPNGSLSTFSIGSPNVIGSNLVVTTPVLRSSTLNAAMDITDTSNVSIDGLQVVGNVTTITGSSKITLKNFDFIDRSIGTTLSTPAVNAIEVKNSGDVLIDGMTIGDKGAIVNTHPYASFVSVSGNTGTVKIRNIGSRTAPLSTPTNSPNYIVDLGTGAAQDVAVQRVYVTSLRGSFAVNGVVRQSNIVVQNAYVNNAASAYPLFSNSTLSGCYGAASSNQPASNYGSHWYDLFTSDTAGVIVFTGNCASDTTAPFQYLMPGASAGAKAVPAQNAFFLPAAGDAVYSEMPRFIIGHTGLANIAPFLVNGGNLTFTYQIDKGAGWNGTWKVANAANLSAETGIDPVVGFKLKIIATCSTAGTTQANNFTMLRVATTSTLANQASNLYPLDVTTLSFEGLQPGSEVRAYVGSIDDPANAVEIGGVESTVGSTFSFTHTAAGQNGYIMIFAMGYKPVIIPRTYQSIDSSLLIQQVVDRNYNNPL